MAPNEKGARSEGFGEGALTERSGGASFQTTGQVKGVTKMSVTTTP
jgi:hypothetical protein